MQTRHLSSKTDLLHRDIDETGQEPTKHLHRPAAGLALDGLKPSSSGMMRNQGENDMQLEWNDSVVGI